MSGFGGAAPAHDVEGIDGHAEDICGKKAQLRGLQPDDADDRAVHRGHHPSLPHTASDEKGGSDGQYAGNIVEMRHSRAAAPVSEGRPRKERGRSGERRSLVRGSPDYFGVWTLVAGPSLVESPSSLRGRDLANQRSRE